MKEPTSKATTRAKATSEAKPAKATKAAKATKPARATRAASSAKTAAVSQLPASTKTATKTTTPSRARSAADYRKEIDGLRKEVEQLKARIAGIHQQSDLARGNAPVAEDAHPWLKIAATVGVTFALGKLMQALRIPAAAAVAVPMITAEVNRRFL
jgi:cell division protein FtsB